MNDISKATLAASLLLLGNSSGWSLELKAATEYPQNTMPGLGLSEYARRVAEQSKGRVTVTPTYQARLTALDALDAVLRGELAVADVHGGPLGSREPMFGLVSLPFVTPSPEKARCLQRVTRAVYAKRFEEIGVHLLYSAPWPATGLWSSVPIESLQDVRRLRVRTYDQMSASFMVSLGVDAFHAPIARALTLAENGEISAIMSSGDGGAGQMLWRYFRHFTALNYAAPLSFAVMNKHMYDDLDENTRRILDVAAVGVEQTLWEIMRERKEINYQNMRNNAVSIRESIPHDLQDRMQQLSNEFLSSWKTRAGHIAEMLLRDFALPPSAARPEAADPCLTMRPAP